MAIRILPRTRYSLMPVVAVQVLGGKVLVVTIPGNSLFQVFRSRYTSLAASNTGLKCFKNDSRPRRQRNVKPNISKKLCVSEVKLSIHTFLGRLWKVCARDVRLNFHGIPQFRIESLGFLLLSLMFIVLSLSNFWEFLDFPLL